MSSITQIAPGLVTFDPSVLKTATGRELQDQLHAWTLGKNSSIFVQWIPDEMKEADARLVFSKYGIVDRVEFVPKFDQNRKQIGRMLFVHFRQFFGTAFANDVAHAHPDPHDLPFSVNTQRGQKNYTLKCRINTRPIPKVEYTTSQLSDMFEGLNSRIMAQLTDMQRQIDDLRGENQFLVRENADLAQRMSEMKDAHKEVSDSVKELFPLVDYPADVISELGYVSKKELDDYVNSA